MSSHVMSEVQKTSDRVGILRDGMLTGVDTVESLRASATRRVEVHFDRDVSADAFVDVAGVSELTVDGALLRCRLDGSADALLKALAARTVLSITSVEPDLEELFMDRFDQEPAEVVEP